MFLPDNALKRGRCWVGRWKLWTLTQWSRAASLIVRPFLMTGRTASFVHPLCKLSAVKLGPDLTVRTSIEQCTWSGPFGAGSMSWKPTMRSRTKCCATTAGSGADNPAGLHLNSYGDAAIAVTQWTSDQTFAAGRRQFLNAGAIATLLDWLRHYGPCPCIPAG
jgi:hypothetical protein